MTTSRIVPLVVAESLGVDYGRNQIFDHLDLEICPGSQTVVTGRSGSGKSTLLLVLAGLLPATRGAVRWPGLSGEMSLRRVEIGMVFQAPSLMPELTAVQNVTLPLRLRGTAPEPSRFAAMEALALVGAADVADALPGELSGGQQQRVAVARVLAGGHRLVLADEPTGSLDREHAHQVVRTLREAVQATGGALILATHDEEIAGTFGDRVEIAPSPSSRTVRR